MKLVTVTNHCALGSSYTKQSNQTSLTEDACSCEDQNGCTVSLACLQQDFGEIEWENHVRVVVIETARDQRKHKRQRRSTEVGSREETLVARGEEPTPVQSPLDQLFEKIYESIDKHTWEDAKTNVQKLQQLLTVTADENHELAVVGNTVAILFWTPCFSLICSAVCKMMRMS